MIRGLRQAGAIACSTMLLMAPIRATEAPLVLKVRTARPVLACLDTVAEARAHKNRVKTLNVEPGRALAFDQQPPLLAPNHTGTIQLADFTVAGDIASLTFRAVDGGVETWARQRMDTLAGRPVSVFQPAWDSSILDRALSNTRWGWDRADLYIGDVVGAGERGADRGIYLRVAPLNIPDVRVLQPAPDVQYSSHVVNIVLPGFSDELVQVEDPSAELARVTTRFYQLFQDTYDAVAVVPQRGLLMPYTAVHFTVKSDVAGIGQDLYDDSATYGSGGRLHAVEMFPEFFSDNQISTHEASHQWGSYVDWTAITGLVRAGHQPDAHDPLWAAQPSRMSAVLDGVRTVVDNGGAYVIAKSAAPVPFTPIQRYAMGILPKAAVPNMVLFDEQGQFTTAAAPAPGTPVVGGVRSASIDQVTGLLGERSGPVPAEWSRATIVVSRGALLSQREMNFWTFYAQRSEDPNHSGIIDFDGFGSFDLASGNVVDFKTDIRPLAGEQIVGPLAVDFPSFGPSDLRGFELNAAIPTLATLGGGIPISGRLTAADRGGFTRLAFCAVQEGEECDNASATVVALGGDGSFSTTVMPGSPGRYQIIAFGVEPGGVGVNLWQTSGFTVN